MNDIIKNEIKMISILDTIHDFKTECGNNKYYNNFINKYKLDKNINQNTVEKYLFKRYNIDIAYNVSLNKFTDSNINTITNSIKKNTFKIIYKTNDTSSINFKNILEDICLSSYNIQQQQSIDFISDTTIIQNDILCSLSNSRVIITDSTYYDRASQLQNGNGCVEKKDIIVRITKEDGLLMELDYIEAGNNEIKYMINGDINEKIIKIKKFIITKDRKYGKSLTFYNTILNSIVNITNNKKDINILNNLLKELENIYKLKIVIFDNNNNLIENKAQQLCNILFDLKRSGDQLQIISAKKNKSIFISNDRMSIALAYILDIPCIRTYKNKNDDVSLVNNNKKNTLLDFFNFDDNIVRSRILKNKDYYKNTFDKNKIKYNNYVDRLIELYNKLLSLEIFKNIDNIKDYIIFNIIYSSIIRESKIFIIEDDEDNTLRRKKPLFNAPKEVDSKDYEYYYLNEFNLIFNQIIYLYIDICVNFDNYKFKDDINNTDYNKKCEKLNDNIIYQLIDLVILDDTTIKFLVKIINNISTFNFEESYTSISASPLTNSKKRIYINSPSPEDNDDKQFKRTKLTGGSINNKRRIIINNNIKLYTFNNNIREHFLNPYLKYKPTINILNDLTKIIDVILSRNSYKDIKIFEENKSDILLNRIKKLRNKCILEINTNNNNFNIQNLKFDYEQDNIFDEKPNFVFNAKYNIDNIIYIKNIYEPFKELINIKYKTIFYDHINNLFRNTYDLTNGNINITSPMSISPSPIQSPMDISPIPYPMDMRGGLNTPLQSPYILSLNKSLNTPVSKNTYVSKTDNIYKTNLNKLKNMGYVGFLTSIKKDNNDKLLAENKKNIKSSKINKILSYDDDIDDNIEYDIEDNIRILKDMTYDSFIDTINKSIINDDKKDITIFILIFLIKQFNIFEDNKINTTLIKYYEYDNTKIKNDIE